MFSRFGFVNFSRIPKTVSIVLSVRTYCNEPFSGLVGHTCRELWLRCWASLASFCQQRGNEGADRTFPFGDNTLESKSLGVVADGASKKLIDTNVRANETARCGKWVNGDCRREAEARHA